MRASSSASRKCLAWLQPRSRPFQVPRNYSTRTIIPANRPLLRQAQARPKNATSIARRSFLGLSTEGEPPAPPPPVGEANSLSKAPALDQSRVLLKPDNLFHPMDQSPSPSMRERAVYIKANAYCPHPNHAHEHPQHIKFTCPDCGVPTYCSEQHWTDDYENHLLICDTLREVNEDDHDLRSGRFFPEFEYPGVQMDEAMINMTNWDTFLYTRDSRAVNEERPLRQVTKLLTFPTTIASFLHELSPYDLRHRLTVEGLRSLSGTPFKITLILNSATK